MVKMAEKVNLLGVGLSLGSREEMVEFLAGKLVEGKGLVRVVTINSEQVVQASDEGEFMRVLNEAEVAVADGVGVVIAERLLQIKNQKSLHSLHGFSQTACSAVSKIGSFGGQAKIKIGKVERIVGVELAEELVGICWKRGLKVMIVGGRLSRAERLSITNFQFSNKFQIPNSSNESRKPGKKDFGIEYHPGAFDVACENEVERAEVLDLITRKRPSLLLVAYGAPWQEKWVAANREELAKAGVRVAMVVGGAVDYWAGKVKRAPSVMRRLGLEWAWRLAVEPWRWRRQLRLLKFVGLVGREAMGSRGELF